MIIFYRQSIVALLLVLQGFSPLVHAHVQGSGVEYGLHIEGTAGRTDNIPELTSFQGCGHCDAVIGMRSAIQQKNLLINKLADRDLDNMALKPVLKVVVSQSSFYSSAECLHKHSISLSAIAPRAPPIIL